MHYVYKTQTIVTKKKTRKIQTILKPGLSGLWPLGKDSDSRLWPYAIASLEYVLSLPAFTKCGEIYEPSSEYVGFVVDALNKDGCRAMIDSIKSGVTSPDWLNNAAECWAKNENAPLLTGSIQVIEHYQTNPDVINWLQMIAVFILFYFNREQDIENQTFKVKHFKETPDRGRTITHLTSALILRSIIDYLEFDAALLRQYRNAKIDTIMTAPEWPKYRTPERDSRSQLTNIYKSAGFKRTADDTLLDLAQKWYKARVEYNTLREAADYFRLDPTDLSKRIRPCDDATRYPYLNS